MKKVKGPKHKLQEFKNSLEEYLSDNTVYSRVNDVKGFFRLFNEVNTATIQAYVGEMRKAGLDTKTIGRRVGSLKAYADFLGIPLSKIKTPPWSRKLPVIATANELRMLRDAILEIKESDGLNAMTLKPMFVLLNAVGRIGEILDVRIKDINFQTETVRFKGKRQKETIKPVVFGLDLLKEYIEYRDKLNIDCQYLLVRRYNGVYKQLGLREFRKELYSFTKKILGDKKITPHSFRHTIATELLNNGADLRRVQEVLGHENIATTQIYTHVAKRALTDILKSKHPLA